MDFKRIADIGCGSGRSTLPLERKYPKAEIIGFDSVKPKICTNRTLSEYYDCITPYYKDIAIWQTNYCHVMNSHNKIVNFVSSTGIGPYLSMLDAEGKERFSSHSTGSN